MHELRLQRAFDIILGQVCAQSNPANDFFKEVLRNYMDQRVLSEMKQSYNNSAEYIIIYDRCWNNFTRFVFVVKSLFSYIDSFFLGETINGKA